jgi:hypothetical protein
LLALAACDDQSSLEQAAIKFRDEAERCLLDVRDNNLKYETSGSCQRLEAVSLAYIEAGGDQATTPVPIAFIAEQGRTMAWMARAISAGAPPLLW